jgi:omega-hydroxypalmitate O-feruloyl transferase
VQVTRFKCGGFCLGLVTSHGLMDGRSTAECVINFASMARGEGLLFEPNFDRTSLKARIHPHINHQHRELLQHQVSMSAFTASGTQAHSPKKLPEMKSYRAFTFSPEMLQRLKQKAMEDNIISRCSTFEVLVAHLWQARTKAVFQDPTQTSSVSFAVDIRSKVNPPLPEGFVGNGVVAAIASASVHDVKENPLSYCVAEIQKAIASITDDYVRSRIDMLGVHSRIPVGINGNFFLSAWWKLPYNGLDFGWGKPVYAGPIVNNLSAHFVLALSNGSLEGIRVWITLEPYQMEKFEQLVIKL